MYIDIAYARSLTDMSAFLRYLVSICGAELYKDKQSLYNLIADLYTGEERQKKLFCRAVVEDDMAQRVYELTKKALGAQKVLADAIAYQFAENNYFSNEVGRKVTFALAGGLDLLGLPLKQRKDEKWEDEQGNIYSEDKLTFERANRRLSEIIVGDGITKIGEDAFENCSFLTTIVMPDTVTEIGWKAFSGCVSLSSVTIPDSVTKIGLFAFGNCASFSSVTIPDSVTEIDFFAFRGCTSLLAIMIPDSVTEIGDGAFSCCTSLNAINVSADNAYFTSVDGVLYSKDRCVLKQCLGAKMSCKIPNGVTKIGNYAFGGCASLSAVTIPDSVTEIGNYAFGGCTSLSAITIPDSVTKIGISAFQDCTSLSSIIIPDSVTEICNYAFGRCTSLSSITIPDSVTRIGNYAFEDCTSLEKIITTQEIFTRFRCRFPKDVQLQEL